MTAGKASRSPRAAWKETRGEVLNRGRRSVALDPKKPGALDAALRLIAEADALIEGVRAGVLERLGPAVCHARNPRLVSGRITDWGRDGPPARQARHDITCLAESAEEAKGHDEIRARLGALGCERSTSTPEALATPVPTRMVRLRRLIHDACNTGG
jgi:hypothetical protein